jgi:ribosomal-protein-alanine N-acetyltransferase
MTGAPASLPPDYRAEMVFAGCAHAAAMSAIHKSAFPPGEAWGEDAIALQLEQRGGFGLVHPAGGFVLARVIADQAEIITLAVAPEARRAGLGAALLAAAMEEAARRGADALFLEVSVANDAARALYAGAGFIESGRRRRYYADGSDALVLAALLAETCPASVPVSRGGSAA